MRVESNALLKANIELRSRLEEAEKALRFYANGGHFDTVRVDGDPEGEKRTRIIDTGATASDALKSISQLYAEMKGCSTSVDTTTTVPFQREIRYIVFKLSDLDDQERTELELLAREVDGRRKILGKQSMKCVVVESDWPEYVPTCAAIERRVNGTEEAPITLETLYPQKCPITRRDFFMIIEHPELGDVPTYGGPFDSYTIPEMDGEPDQPFHERELFQRRYDHDAGAWVDGVETIPLRVINDEVLMAFEDQVNASRASLEHHCNHWEAIAKRLPKAVLGGVDLPLDSETGNAAVVIKVIDLLENEVMNKDMQQLQQQPTNADHQETLLPIGPKIKFKSNIEQVFDSKIMATKGNVGTIVGHHDGKNTVREDGNRFTFGLESDLFEVIISCSCGIKHKEWCAAEQDVRDGFDHIRDCDCGAQ